MTERTPSDFIDKHVLSSVLAVLEKHPASQSLHLLEGLRIKSNKVFDENIKRFPELNAIFHGERPIHKERLFLLNTIP